MHGDVVVAPDEREPGRFTITQLPGSPQVSDTSQKVAIAMARRFARHFALDVWLTPEAGAGTARIYRYRRPRARTS